MTAHYTYDNFRKHAHIGMTITTSTDGDILAVLVSNVINQFCLGSKLVGITIDGGTNLAICTAILDSTFDNTRIFDMGKPMFVMEFFSYILANAWMTGVMHAAA